MQNNQDKFLEKHFPNTRWWCLLCGILQKDERGCERYLRIFENFHIWQEEQRRQWGVLLNARQAFSNLQDSTWRGAWWSFQVPLVFLIRIFQRESILTNSQLSADFVLGCWFCRGQIACPVGSWEMHTNWTIAIMYNWNSLKSGQFDRGKQINLRLLWNQCKPYHCTIQDWTEMHQYAPLFMLQTIVTV